MSFLIQSVDVPFVMSLQNETLSPVDGSVPAYGPGLASADDEAVLGENKMMHHRPCSCI